MTAPSTVLLAGLRLAARGTSPARQQAGSTVDRAHSTVGAAYGTVADMPTKRWESTREHPGHDVCLPGALTVRCFDRAANRKPNRLPLLDVLGTGVRLRDKSRPVGGRSADRGAAVNPFRSFDALVTAPYSHERGAEKVGHTWPEVKWHLPMLILTGHGAPESLYGAELLRWRSNGD